jgi:hypothetical protein
VEPDKWLNSPNHPFVPVSINHVNLNRAILLLLLCSRIKFSIKHWWHQYEQTNNHISPQIIVHKNDHDIWHMHNADRNNLRQQHKCDRVKSLNHLLWCIIICTSCFIIVWYIDYRQNKGGSTPYVKIYTAIKFASFVLTDYSLVDIDLWLFVGWYWLILTCDYSLVDIGWYWPVIIRWLILVDIYHYCLSFVSYFNDNVMFFEWDRIYSYIVYSYLW